MFQRARLRLTLLYIALMGVTLALVAGGILVLGAQQARRTEDQTLQLRAESLAARPVRFVGRPQPPDPNQEAAAIQLRNRLQQEGILFYDLPVLEDTVLELPPDTPIGLPSVAAAQAAVRTRSGQFATLSIETGEVRVYSLPIVRNGQIVAVTQVARSRYFVDATVTRLLMVVIGAGAAGLLLSAGASFWLADRTLRPIAVALQRQRDFTADASHELRTPLALVRGNAELLLRHPDEQIGAYGDVVHDIVDESDRLTRLVSDLLTLARADSGHIQIVRIPVNLSELANEILQDVEPLARAKRLGVRGDIPAGVFVTGDRDRLRQLCLILLDNAIRYTEAGGVTLRVARDGHMVALSVSDTGRGIASEHLSRIFDRFYRTDAARSADQGGAGLGLAIAKWIAEAHGGRITAASNPNRGSTFSVYLPRATTPRIPSGDASLADPPRGHGDTVGGIAGRSGATR
jgi:signal transduction histidine kinase